MYNRSTLINDPIQEVVHYFHVFEQVIHNKAIIDSNTNSNLMLIVKNKSIFKQK